MTINFVIVLLDINECFEAAMKGQQLCNQTQVCVNQLGSFMCQCPPGTELNAQGTCQVPTPLLPSTPTPPTTTATTTLNSTSQFVVMTTTSILSATPSVPAGADHNQVIVTLGQLTVANVGQ